jgi:hypothetical protein
MVEYIVANDGVASSSLVSCSVYLTRSSLCVDAEEVPVRTESVLGFIS